MGLPCPRAPTPLGRRLVCQTCQCKLHHFHHVVAAHTQHRPDTLPQKVVAIISADKAKTQTYCEIHDRLEDVPKSMLSPESESRKASLNHVGGRHKQSIGQREPQRFCRFSIKEEFNRCRFFDREISGFGTLQNLVYKNSRTATHRRLVSSIGH